jgi:hypothetical protein
MFGRNRRLAEPPGSGSGAYTTAGLATGEALRPERAVNKLNLIAAMIGCMAACLATARTSLADPVRTGAPDQPRADTAAPGDTHVQALLQQVLRQISQGKTAAPEGDNAIATWKSLLSIVIPPSPAVAKAMADFARDARQRAAEELAAGRTMTAMDLSLFAAEATDILHGGQTTAPRPPSGAAADSPKQSAQENPIRRTRDLPPANPAGDAAADAHENAAMPIAQAPAAAADPALASIATDRRSAGNLTMRSDASSQPPSDAAEESRPAPLAPVLPQAAPPRTAAEQAAAEAAVRRGDAMMAMKDIPAARSFFAYAANAGNARAAEALAETYDPVVLRRLNVIGPKPDSALAANWYRRAAMLGDRTAEARIRTLQTDAAK